MAYLSDQFIDELLARTDIVEIIGARIPLKKNGKEYSARCPFHDERSPSFTVSPTKQFYHCFGCGAHGTAISFLMNYDRFEFLDAVEELAKRVGMEVPKNTQQKNRNNEFATLQAALAAASRFYQQQLQASSLAMDYLQSRHIDTTTAEQFAIGYAPDGFSALKDALATDARRLKILQSAGMMSSNDRGHTYDKFRKRLMFPIFDRRGRVIAFGGRVIDGNDSPKYLNSPETVLFHKGRELYGLWQARQSNQTLSRLIVVEGYMDVVALFQHGITQAVATLGTATTPDHIELLFRNTADVYFCFDGDRAGRAAAWKAVESCVAKMRDGRQAHFLFLPEGEDPDSIIRKEGNAGFETRLAQAIPLSRFLFQELERDIDVHSIDGKSRLWSVCKPLIASMPDGAFRDRMIEELHKRAGNPNRFEREQLGTGQGLRSTQLNPFEAASVRVKSGRQESATRPKRSLVRSAITFLVQMPALAADIQPPYQFLSLQQPGIDLLTELFALTTAQPDLNTAAVLTHFNMHPEFSALQKLAATNIPGEEEDLRLAFADTIAQLNQQATQLNEKENLEKLMKSRLRKNQD